MSARRLPVRSRLALGYAAVLLVSGALLLTGAYVIVGRASTRYDRAVAAQVEHRLAERRARVLPAQLGGVTRAFRSRGTSAPSAAPPSPRSAGRCPPTDARSACSSSACWAS